VALAGQTGGANRVVLDFLFLLSTAEECIKTKERRIVCDAYISSLFLLKEKVTKKLCADLLLFLKVLMRSLR
jgi:hypothetical protein